MVRCSWHTKRRRHQNTCEDCMKNVKTSELHMQDCIGGLKCWDSEIHGNHRCLRYLIAVLHVIQKFEASKVRRAGARQNCSGDSRASSSLLNLQSMLKAPQREAVSSKLRVTHPSSGPAADEARCSTVQSMAPSGFLPPPNHTNKTHNQGPETTNQNKLPVLVVPVIC